ncbi:MAG: hypothetical protein ACTSWN_16955 [Promethearchaeota archaeon]
MPWEYLEDGSFSSSFQFYRRCFRKVTVHDEEIDLESLMSSMGFSIDGLENMSGIGGFIVSDIKNEA